MQVMKFHEKVVTLCAQKNWDQADLWRAVGKKVSRTTVSNWFNGVSRPDMDTSLSIARAFSVPLDFLADDDQDDLPPSSDLPEDEAAVLRFYRNLKSQGAIDEGTATTGMALYAKQRPGDSAWSGRIESELQEIAESLNAGAVAKEVDPTTGKPLRRDGKRKGVV